MYPASPNPHLVAHLAFDLVLLDLCEAAAAADDPSLSYIAALLAAMRAQLDDAVGLGGVERAFRFLEQLAAEHLASGSPRASPAAAASDAGAPLHERLIGLYTEPLTGEVRGAHRLSLKARAVH